jgi:hypothetical protein
LNALSTDWVDRRNVEEALGVSKTVAWRIMRQHGAGPGPGNTVVCRRAALIQALESFADSGAVRQEVKRRARVEERLDQLARHAVSTRVEVARDEAAAVLLSSRLAGLPEGVDMARGALSIRFGDMQDFLRKFGAVVFALQNDYDAVERVVNGDYK